MNRKLNAVTMLVAGAVLLSAGALGTYYALLTIHNTGSMGVVAVYFDQACTLPAQTIAWNTTVPGQTVDETVWLKNFGSSPVTLNMTIANWSPLNASSYMSVSWDHEGAILNSGVEQAKISLTVYANATSSGISGFSFDFNINEAW